MHLPTRALATVLATAVAGLAGAPASSGAASVSIASSAPTVAPGAPGDAGWEKLSGVHPPLARSGHDMAYDAGLGETIMFGGYDSTGLAHGTWAWDGTSWRKLATLHTPPRRANPVMAYDPVRDEVVLFGGDRFGARDDEQLHARNDTWVFADGDWTRADPQVSPAPTTFSTMAFDPHLQQLIMFGGAREYEGMSGAVVQETWAWDGVTWRELDPGTKPPIREGSDLAFDPTRGRLVLFGGHVYGGIFLNDTWSWDGETWEKESAGVAPPRRAFHNVATFGDQVAVFGGYGPGIDVYYDDTWVLTSDGWEKLDSRPAPATQISTDLEWDPLRHEAVLFGGVVYKADQPARVSDQTWTLRPEG